MTQKRVSALRSQLNGVGVDAMLISNVYNRRYLSGFTGTACTLLVNSTNQILATDSRYTEQAAGESPGWEIHNVQKDPKWIATLAQKLGIHKLGVEADDLTVVRHERIVKDLKAVDCEVVATDGLVAGMRMTKDDTELENLQNAARIGDEALMEATRDLQPGITEHELAVKYLIAARRLGASDLSFSTIVASGPNAARPHHQPTDREICEGEPIVFDCGVIYNGYCSDLTRTIVIGEPSPKLREVYNVVLEAQHRGIEAVKVGLKGKDVDAISREVIQRAGYGEQFGHGLGHGVGLEIHEEPYVAPRGEKVLELGSVVTVEPGIYIPGWGGVRIEDMVAVDNNGARLLSKAPKMNL